MFSRESSQIGSKMVTVSPPKPWESGGGVIDTDQQTAGDASKRASTSVSVATATTPTSSAPALPERPPSLSASVNRNGSAFPPYISNRVGVAPSYGAMPPQYSNPYQRIGAMGYPGMYGIGNGMGYGSMGNIYNGMGGLAGVPNDSNSLTNGFTRNTQSTFQMIENIVGAFGGLAQMLESTYMATHSSFFAMVSVAEQFGNLKNTLGSILGIFTLLRWLRTIFARLTGRPPPVDAISLTPSAFAIFEGRKNLPDGTPINLARPSKKPFLFFIAAAFGLPYLMGKLIQSLAASQEDEKNRLASLGLAQSGPSGGSVLTIDPSKLDFCRVLYDFTPDQELIAEGVDLAVKKGDLVAVLSQTDPAGNPSDWWRCRARDGRMGYLPKVYLELARRTGQSLSQVQGVEKTMSLASDSKDKSKPSIDDQSEDLTLESYKKSQFYS
ncbi:Peroxisomal membrane protein PAS20 [Golovinomyces cichoracearum]|uniref:Peroxisomal membrane protein PEX13 n=1 Tax=Golovinomyces cichoracearum TaxID=62708 RepID=A0A420J0C7_9PEZI|nr:Peroxisomal membrane protein PAS20 [Golovinomyces cichoracearum]